MEDNELLSNLWKGIEVMDSTVGIIQKDLPRLKRKFVAPEPYSRQKMYQHMAQRTVAVFQKVPVLVVGSKEADTRETLVHALSTKFATNETNRVQVGSSHRVTRLPVREIMRRWSGGRSIIGVTDLHIRDTRVEEVIDTNVLSFFNLLIRGSENLATQEMMTLVIASPGNVTDSHSDDPDGTNHCFFGKKLWLAWDTFEGIEVGLEDVERQDIYGQAKFSMEKFLSLKSSRWFLVSTGETLFLPGGLTHKVFTLESYIGVGSFHVGLPSCLDSLTRWIFHGPLWSMNDPKKECVDLVDETARITLEILRMARNGSQKIKNHWGYNDIRQSYEVWKTNTNSKIRNQTLEHPDFRAIIDIAKSA